jgi:O-antigen ligase
MSTLLSETEQATESWAPFETPAYAPVRRTHRLATIALGLVFLLVGLFGSAFALPLAAKVGGFVASALILIAPVAIGVVLKGCALAWAKWKVLRRQLHWWHWLWFALLASGFVFRVRDANTAKESPVDSAAIYRLGLVALTGGLLLLRQVRKQTVWLGPLFQGLIGAMTMFALVSATSALWSVNGPWTLYKSIEYLVDLMLLAAILVTIHSVKDYEALFNWNWTLTGLLILSAWVGAAIWPKEALDAGFSGGMLGYRLSGVYPGQGSNRLGDLGAILGVVCIARLLPLGKRKYDRLWYTLLLGLGVLTIVVSQTRSALIGLVAGTIIILAFTGRLKRGALIVMGIVGLILVSGVGSLLLEFLQRGQSREEMVSLSDRLNWWSVGFQLLSEHPWTGLGAFAAGPFGVFEKLGLNNVGPLHSDYIETMVGTSFWGVIPLLIALFGCWWVLLRWMGDRHAPAGDRQLAMEAIAVLTVITLRSVFMTFIVMHPPLNFTVILCYAESVRRRRKALRSQAQAAVPDAVAA